MKKDGLLCIFHHNFNAKIDMQKFLHLQSQLKFYLLGYRSI